MGEIPDSHYYDPEGMSPEDREKFFQWYNPLKENHYVFDFREVILNYCRSDVDILQRCCLQFRELFRDVTAIDPFEECLTIASACNDVFRKNFLEEDVIAIIPPHGYNPENRQSVLARKWLSYTAEKNNIHIQHAHNGGEKRVGSHYLLDGYHAETNTAYEVHGCFWHGCLKCYARATVNTVNGKTMHDLHQATVEKATYLKGLGYDLVELWECQMRCEMEQDSEMKQYFAQHEAVEPLKPRDAFYGGRTNAAKLYHQCGEDEQIKYVDFTSLYPWCNKMTRTVTGHPRIITENFEEDLSVYFGLIKCTVLPPRGLFHPVLPYRTQGKLMFPLCKQCADDCHQDVCTHDDNTRAIQGTWCSVELEKALEKGYKVLKVHEVWHFSHTSDKLFAGYIDTFLKIKQESSGYPRDCITEEQRQRYVDEYLRVEGIQLDREKIAHNPGMRALAKLMLNSFWGKFAQRSNMVKTEQIRDPQKYFDYLTSDAVRVLDANLVSDDLIEIRYEHTENFIEADAKTNVVVAAFTTAYARLKLYGVLDTLQERAFYYDTDSVIFMSKPGEPDPPLGPYLGELTDELGGDHITTYVSGGPKNYAYRTNEGKVETKIRGITLNCTARQTVNIDVVQELVQLYAMDKEERRVTVDIPYKITRDNRTKNIVTKHMKKDYRIVYNKRVIVENYKTLPYGY